MSSDEFQEQRKRNISCTHIKNVKDEGEIYRKQSKMIALKTQWRSISYVNSFTTKKQTTKFSSASFLKNVKSKLYHTENSKTRVQIV